MHVPLICAAFAISLNLHTVISQCTGCGCETSPENLTKIVGNESPIEDRNQQSSSTWLDIESMDVKGIVRSVMNWMQNAWDSEVKLKLQILRNEQNDTLMNVQLRDLNSMTDRNIGRMFGIRRRMQLFFMLPISFKLGIIMTLLLVLTAVSLKTLVIGFVILLLLLHHTQAHAKLLGPYKTHQLSASHKDIHIHIHTSPGDHHPSWHEPSEPVIYSA